MSCSLFHDLCICIYSIKVVFDQILDTCHMVSWLKYLNWGQIMRFHVVRSPFWPYITWSISSNLMRLFRTTELLIMSQTDVLRLYTVNQFCLTKSVIESIQLGSSVNNKHVLLAWQLILVIVGSVLGGLLLIAIILLPIVAIKWVSFTLFQSFLLPLPC